MTPAEILQTVLGIVAVGGIGGVWFKLGQITAQHDGLRWRVAKLEGKIDNVQNAVTG